LLQALQDSCFSDRHERPTGSGAMPLTLARLTEEFLRFADLLADVDPSDADALALIQKQLDTSATDIRTKATSIAAVIREFEASADVAQAEADRIVAHARAAKSRATWLREYLLKNLQAVGADRIQTATALIAIRESPPAAEVLNEDELPDAFKRVVHLVDKVKLRKALLDGEVVPGAHLTRGNYLSIR
jgi:hypothetical protein